MRIRRYITGWTLSNSTGFIRLLIGNNDDTNTWQWTPNIPIVDKESYSIIVDLLRNESPVLWHPASGTISTAAEPTGEAE